MLEGVLLGLCNIGSLCKAAADSYEDLPGMVSHSVAEEPTSWKHCCAIFRYSCDCCCCPTAAYTTPAEGGRSLGLVGYAGKKSRLMAALKLYSTRSAAPAEGLLMGSWQDTCRQTAKMLTTPTIQSSLGPTQNKRVACGSALATSWAFQQRNEQKLKYFM